VRESLNEIMRFGHGDVLVFLPTERDIRECAKELTYLQNQGTEILPLFARLSSADQMKVFNPTGKQRRIVLATNVAETSITVPGIRYVIDSGLARMSRYSARAGVQRLPIEAISQASADQRKGRCGRVDEGVCIRLYSEEDYQQRDRYTTPEIMRTNLSAVILQMKALRLGPVQLFPFLDPPRPSMIKQGFKTLHELGAVDEDGVLSKIGWQLATFPVDPRVARMLIAGHSEDALDEVLVLASVMSVQDPRERPSDKRDAADSAHRQFNDENSDLLTLLNLWKFLREQHHKLSRNQFRRCCIQNFLSPNRVREWMDVCQQLTEMAREQKLHRNHKPATSERVHRALLAGLLAHTANVDDGFVYRGTGGNKVFLFPGSVLFKKKPKWIMAAELVETGKLYARTLAIIDPNWLEPLAGHLVKKSYNQPRWDRKSARAMVNEKVTMLGLTIVGLRRCPMDQYDKVKAREMFIHYGLVEQDMENSAPFALHNQRLLKEAQQMQAKLRKHNLLASNEQRYQFFDDKLPASEIASGPHFEKWRKQAEAKEPKLLFMQLSDFLAPDIEPADSQYFPDKAEVFGIKLKLNYRADFGHEDDGVTASVPVDVMGQLEMDHLHKLVPGLLEQKINALIRALPKEVRRHYIPISQTAKQCVDIVAQSGFPLTDAICEALQQVAGFAPDPRSLDLSILPEYLQPNVRVVDARGKTLAKGRDLDAVKKKVGSQIGQRLAQIEHPKFTKTGITRWDFGDLPMQIITTSRGIKLPGYPTLVDHQTSVSLELMQSPEMAQQTMRQGLLRLFVLQIGDQLNQQVGQLSSLRQLALDFATFGHKKQLTQWLTERAAMMTFLVDDPEIRTRGAFAKRFEDTWGNLAGNVRKLAVMTGQILQAARAVDVHLENTWPSSASDVIKSLRQQRQTLVPADFLLSVPDPWLSHLPRYLAAMTDRLSKLVERRYDRDAELCRVIVPYSQAWVQLTVEQQGSVAGVKYFWMLQEFYVAQFAQHLGTSMTISGRRLDK
ncbi:MAG: ATP-dependent RNA helicase HrpA, partial [Phycisphaeraceae bacterium]|nr:ATP-dependent RNA helicase HrpA [Phycisphaeraceae bacterium]